MRKNTCILIRNWRKLPQNTNRRICSSSQDLQTQDMNIKVTNIISDIPSCCICLGTCVGAHSPWNTHTLPKHSPSCHRPRAGSAWELAPLMCGFPGAVSHSKVPFFLPRITALGLPSSHWGQAQSRSVGSPLRDSSTRLFFLKEQLRAKVLLPLFPSKVPEAKPGLRATQSLSSCLCLGRHTWSHRCKRQEAAAVEGLKINWTWPLMQQRGSSCFHSPV